MDENIISEPSMVEYGRDALKYGHSPVRLLDDMSFNKVMSLDNHDKLFLIQMLAGSMSVNTENTSNAHEPQETKRRKLQELCGSWID